MNFGLSHEQQMLITTVRDFIKRELQPLEEEVERSNGLRPDVAKAIFEKSSALGLYAMNIPTTYGGGGLSTLDWMLVEEEFGHTTDILVRRAFGNVYEILLEATQEQHDRWFLPSVRGERTFSIAFSEPDAGSDAAGIRSCALADGDGWILNGNKHYISDALYSDFFVVTAITDPSAGARGITTFIVDRDVPGFSVGQNQEMMGLRGTTHAELFFDSVKLGPEHVLGIPGQGLKRALSTLGRVRLAQVCARAVGKATRLLDLALEHARTRRQFDKTIDSFQLIQQQLSDSAIEINSTRLALLQAAWMIDEGLDARAQISAVKVQAAEMLGRVADRTVQIFGGSGFSKELPIERYYRDARIYRIFDGTSEIHRTVLSKSLSISDGSFYKWVT